ncbi:MAG TPA: rRNA maturation RNase YbeY [Gammaproteobacteria bacterium]|nr:rRNA maturation RNase YbeY [Gammaproteobacteria bacterium]
MKNTKNKRQHNIDVQKPEEQEPGNLPDDRHLKDWVNAALSDLPEVSDMTIRVVDEAEILMLNNTYRHKNYLTNVLSFPADIPAEVGLSILGDVVICAEVVRKEAIEQQKKLDAHWAHMVVHGTLHLLGYDHLNDEDAEAMETKEIEILACFGYPNPYLNIEGNTLTK